MNPKFNGFSSSKVTALPLQLKFKETLKPLKPS